MKKMVEQTKTNKKRATIIFIAIIITIILVIFGAKIYLLVNLLLGNDVLIQLDTDKENLFLFHNQSEQIKIKTNIFTNPFCKVNCDFSFIDLSSNKTIEKNSFSLKVTKPISKAYNLISPLKGIGQKLYRFDIQCKSPRTWLCHTKDDLKTRIALITLNYGLDYEEQALKQDYKSRTISIIKKIDYFNLNLKEFNNIIDELNKTFDTVYFQTELNEINQSISSFNNSILTLKDLWEREEYQLLFDYLYIFEKNLNETEEKFNIVKIALFSNLNTYNNLINNMISIESELKNLQKNNVTNATLSGFNKVIKEFNNLTYSFNKKEEISIKEEKILILYNKTNYLLLLIQQENESLRIYASNESIAHFNFSVFEIKEINSSLIIDLNEPSQICCLFGNCKECCNDSCHNEPEMFPIVFVHGHDFSTIVSAEYVLSSFDEMQRALEKYGYLNTGSLFPGSYDESLKGIFGKIRTPVSIKISYYFDILKSSQGNIVFQTKKDNLDTYAIRLNDIIKQIKYRTGKNKVILVTHSMGGLVARRYMQIFGENDVQKLIMISSPNNGISGKILKICSLFGSKLECSDMDKASLFLNKLNNGKKPNMPVYNIIGIGCDTEGETGDWIVTNSSSYLEGADNYFIKGKCNGINYLHSEILLPSKYPEVLKLVEEFIKKE